MRHPVYLTAAILLALCGGGRSEAQTSAAKPIVIEQPWARATPGGARTGAAYMTLINNGPFGDRLLGATTPLADKVQFHKVSEDNGVSRMREVPVVDLEPGARIIFRPGEMHMMIVGLKQPLVEGQNFQLTLQFEKAGNVELTVPIEHIGAIRHDDMGSMTHSPDDGMKR